jgi:hypothetical protein
MYRELAEHVARGHAATVARIGARPTDARALGYHVERLYARATGGACWRDSRRCSTTTRWRGGTQRNEGDRRY